MIFDGLDLPRKTPFRMRGFNVTHVGSFWLGFQFLKKLGGGFDIFFYFHPYLGFHDPI